MKCKLSDICSYYKNKVDVSCLTKENYISTENMLSDKGGVTTAKSLPTTMQTQEYKKNYVLVSNIRPYFKKIWYADKNGGCSNDVLVFKAKDGVDSRYLYYILANDTFFEYSMATSKGTKMPRGDKKALMEYEVPAYSIEEQQRIVSMLSSLDSKIQLNNRINKNLEAQLQAIFINSFADQISVASIETCPMLGDLVSVIDNRGKTPPLTTGTFDYPIIDVGALKGNGRVVDFNNCTKYVDRHTYETWFRSGHPEPWDILISTVGSLAEIKLFLGTKGCIAQNVVAFRTKDVSPLYLYQYLYFIRADLMAYNIGSVQPSIKVTHIIKHPIFIPTHDALKDFDEIAKSITGKLYANYNENETLKTLRDLLLPKFMSGEIDVSNIEL